MNCPFCGEELVLGNVFARGGAGMYWLPEEERMRFLVSNKSVEQHGGVVLVGVDHIGTVSHTAYACPACKRIILESV